MPQGEHFWNPYRMVPVREVINRMPPVTHEKFQGKSGKLTCTLENLTPLFIAKNNEGNPRTFLTRDRKHIIPGSSLKGMLRSLAEVVGGGCFVTDKNGRNCHNDFKSCDQVTSLCVACRMFGMMEQRANAKVHTGKVSISDAVIQAENAQTQNYQVLLNGPKSTHRSFYISPHTGDFDGRCRKFYFHQPGINTNFPGIPNNLADRAWTVPALTPGHRFEFDITFSNLRDEELDLLIYILILEEDVQVTIGGEENRIRLNGPLRHKIGNAKPMGMGSCHIRIESLTIFADPASRFLTLAPLDSNNGNGNATLSCDRLAREIEYRIRQFVRDHCPAMDQLRKVLVWDPADPRVFHYPGHTWFGRNGNVRLKLI